MQNELPLFIYDCFTNQNFGGNVGGIVLDAGALEPDKMQIIAREVNAAVTGFVTKHNGAKVSARFFMPEAEIAMCGHVVVGLFSYLYQQDQSIKEYILSAGAGDIRVRIGANETALPDVMMQLSAPTTPEVTIDIDALSSALGISRLSMGSGIPVGVADAGLKHICVYFGSLSDVQNLTPDFKKLSDVCNNSGVHTVACFSMDTDDPDNTLHIRDFCPALGVDEVPASGTTNAALVGYMVKHGLIPVQSQKVLAEQGAELGRPSQICSQIIVQDGHITELWVGGQAVASIKGVLVT